MGTGMLQKAASYEELRGAFRWQVPEHYNIGVDICDRHATGERCLALVFQDEGGTVRRFTFDEIKAQSNRFASVLAAHGLVRGDRLAIVLPQAPETAIAHVAAYKAGLVAVPLFTLFGEDALAYRLSNSGAAALVTDRTGYAKIAAIRERLPDLRHIYLIEGSGGAALAAPSLRDATLRASPAGRAQDFAALVARASDAFNPVATCADDPALIVYTSGTTGNPKGALHAHRVLLGHLPGVELPHEFFPQKGDLFWTPADWAWVGGLEDVLMPAWHNAVPVLAYRARKFDPEEGIALMAAHDVRNVFLPPTALKLMRQSHGGRRPAFALRTVASGGETLGGELLDWGRATFGLTINEFYGQTECNLLVGNAAGLFPVRAGSMGRAIPGPDIRIVDAQGRIVPHGESRLVVMRRPDPGMFLEYWRNEAATPEKFAGECLITGDLPRQDEGGYFWF